MEQHRRLALYWIGSGFALVALLALRQWLAPWWLATFERLIETEALQSAHYFLGGTFMIGAIPLWVLAGWLVQLARRTYLSGEYPPPGVLLLRPVRQRQGQAARRMVYQLFSVAFGLVTLSVVWVWQSWKLAVAFLVPLANR